MNISLFLFRSQTLRMFVPFLLDIEDVNKALSEVSDEL